MEYLFYCRDKPGSMPLRMELNEAHWSFMDAYAESMIARGPTLSDDGETVTGSLHIVDLADTEAVRTFAFDEPNYRAGVYEDDVLIRRWSNTLGRTMWDFGGGEADNQRFLILAHGWAGVIEAGDEHAHLVAGGYEQNLIAYGPLLSDDGSAWMGTAILAELPDRTAAEAMMASSPYSRAGLYESVEIHPWRFGGRPQS